MHIVHIEDFFHPSAGYKYNIISKYMVKFGHKVTIVTPNLDYRDDVLTDFFGNKGIDALDKDFTNKYGVDIVRINVKKYFRTRALYNLKELNKIVSDLNPDILTMSSEQLPYYYYLLRLSSINFPIVFDCHNTESVATSKFVHIYRFLSKTFFSKIINKNDIRVIRCINDNYIEKCLGIPIKNSPIVSFGSDLSLFHVDNNVRTMFRRKCGIEEDSIVFTYVGKLDKSKGGVLLANAFNKRFIFNKRIYLLVVGNTSRENKDEIDNLFKTSENTIIRFNTQKYVDLPKFYQIADVAIFPKQCSLSFFDAQACGLPVIAENFFVNNERLSQNNGFVFESGSIESLRNKIQNYIDLSNEQKKEMSNNAIQYITLNYNYVDRAKEYLNVLIDEYNKYHMKKDETFINKINI